MPHALSVPCLFPALLSLLAFLGSVLPASSGSLLAWGSGPGTNAPTDLSNVIAVSARADHGIALLSNGGFVQWGRTNGSLSTPPEAATNLLRVAAGDKHCAVLRADGVVLAWGANTEGQITVPPDATNVIELSAGTHYTAALRADGTVLAWGKTWDGGGLVPITTPADLTNVAAIAAGNYHGLALLSNSTVRVFGSDPSGLQVPPAGLEHVTAIACGGQRSLALTAEGCVLCWGDTDVAVPAEATNVTALAAGEYHNVALRADGSVLAWGNNAYGQSDAPRSVTNALAVAGGVEFTVAIVGSGPGNTALRITEGRFADGRFEVVIRGVPGRMYALEFCEGLPGGWVRLEPIRAEGEVVWLTDPAPGAGARFYRAVEVGLGTKDER